MKTWIYSLFLVLPVAASANWTPECEKSIDALLNQRVTQELRAREIYDQFLKQALGDEVWNNVSAARKQEQEAVSRLAELDLQIKADPSKGASLQDERQKLLTQIGAAQKIFTDASLAAGKNSYRKAEALKKATAEGFKGIDWMLGLAEMSFRLHNDEPNQRYIGRSLMLTPSGARAGTFSVYRAGHAPEMMGERMFMAHISPKCEVELGRSSMSAESRAYARSVFLGGDKPAPAVTPTPATAR